MGKAPEASIQISILCNPEHPGCSWDDACDWYEQITGRTVPEEQYGEIEQVWEEESQNWEPTDDQMMGSFGTPWHDGL